MFNYEGRRELRATPNLSSVPTLAMREGDFSEIVQPGNRWYPNDSNPAVTRAITFPGSSTPFPNNIIPPSRINPGKFSPAAEASIFWMLMRRTPSIWVSFVKQARGIERAGSALMFGFTRQHMPIVKTM
jgi:hypothetical protein